MKIKLDPANASDLFKEGEVIMIASYDCTLIGYPENYGLPPIGTPPQYFEIEYIDPNTGEITIAPSKESKK